MLTIGEVANLKGITIKALRYYERIGLLKPYYIDPSNNYRYYRKEQFILMDIIKAARALEVSPKDLIPLFANQDSEQIMAYLKGYTTDVKNKIQLLEKMLLQIEAAEHAYHDAHSTYKETAVYVKEIPARNMVTVPLPKKLGNQSISAVYDRLDAAVSKRGLINTYQTGVLMAAQEDIFEPSKLVMIVSYDSCDKNDYEMLPGGAYICVNYKTEDAEKQQRKLNKYLQENNIVPKAIVQMDLLIDFFEKDTHYFELQVLI